MSVCVFAGPTITRRDGAVNFDGVWLPPARHGDVFRAVSLLRPRAIGIVDGYFQWVPSVRHQEILWAIDQGVHVFGSASMGALRAAELASFGMRGAGRIFEAYCTGRLEESGDEAFEDDDEVAVVHGPAECGYLVVSEAMVNIRCTLAAAEHSGVIAFPTRKRLAAIAKSLYFPERSYERLLELAHEADLPLPEVNALRAWLPRGRVNQKRADAVTMLEAMRVFLAHEPAPAQAPFAFEHTTLWKRGFEDTYSRVHDEDELGVLAELRLHGASWETLRDEVTRSHTQAHPADDASSLTSRLAEHADRPEEMERILERAQRAAAARRMRDKVPQAAMERQILARLRDTGEYATWSIRAGDKRRRICCRTDLPDIENFSGLQLLQLRDWFFSHVRREDMPDDLDAYFIDWGYEDESQFHQEIFSEYVYRQMTDGANLDSHGSLGHA